MPRQILVNRAQSGQTLAALLHHVLHRRWADVRQLVRDGQVALDGKPCTDPGRVLRKGQQIQLRAELSVPAPRPGKGRGQTADRKTTATPRTQGKKPSPRPASNADTDLDALDNAPPASDAVLAKPIIRYADAHIVVVDKPAGLTTVRHAEERKEFGQRAQKYLPPTLVDMLPQLVDRNRPRRRGRIRAVHRLDRDTSGLVVFARTDEAERELGKQMRAHSVGRKYLALVRGQPRSERIESNLLEDRGDGRRGSTSQPGAGKQAVTHVQVLEQLGDMALVECTLETGRTHQVRIHLGERGTPLCGERIYDRPIHGAPLPDASGAERPLLHASFLQITHPASRKRMTWSAPLPRDMKSILKKLRRQRVIEHGQRVSRPS
jgi:23S rRNA pseudouridine1911/1915/1917 synthase